MDIKNNRLIKMLSKLFPRSRKQQDILIRKAFVEGWSSAALLSHRKCVRDIGMTKDKVYDLYERGRVYNTVSEAWAMSSFTEDQ